MAYLTVNLLSFLLLTNDHSSLSDTLPEHRSITGHVPVLLLPNDGRAVAALILFDRDGGPCRRRNNAHHCTIFPLLLQVSESVRLMDGCESALCSSGVGAHGKDIIIIYHRKIAPEPLKHSFDPFIISCLDSTATP